MFIFPEVPESTWVHPEIQDIFSFHLGIDNDVMLSAGTLVHRNYAPAFSDDRKMRVMPVYAPGEDFGVFVRLWPAHEGHPAPDGYQLDIISQWTRLDVVSMNNLDRRRNRALARREAWEAVQPYIEGRYDTAPPPPA